MNKTKINWPDLDYTWNSVVGCRRNCYYCYARELNNRFKFIKKWNKPQFFEERLEQPGKVKKPSVIFVGSMCDLFGEWVPDEWIDKIIEVCKIETQHTYMFLTKNPIRYFDFRFPENCQLGATVTNPRTRENVMIFEDILYVAFHYKNKIFLSIEPLLGSFKDFDLSKFNQIIVGAMTGKNAVVPEQEWIKSIQHTNIHFKTNIHKYLGTK